MKQIIQYRRQNGFSARHDVGQLGMCLIAFHHSTLHDNRLAYLYGALLLVLHQNHSLVTGLLRKMFFYIPIVVIYKTQQIL